MKSATTALALAALCTLAVAAPRPGQALSGGETAPIVWPETGRPSFKVTTQDEIFDGYPVTLLHLSALDVGFKLASRPQITIDPNPSARYSLSLHDEGMPGISINFSVFNKGEFLPNLEQASWQAYLDGLSQSGHSVVFENSNIDQAVTPYVLSQQFRQVAYEAPSEGANRAKRREIFAFVGDSLLVITIHGSKNDVDRYWFQVESLISELSEV